MKTAGLALAGLLAAGLFLTCWESAALAAADGGLRYAGVNLVGAEFKPNRLPGRAFKDYTFPRDEDFAYFAARGMNLIRLPFLWERLQPSLSGQLDRPQLDYLRKTVALAKLHHMAIVLDLHNYGRYRGQEVGSPSVPNTAFADLWRRLAAAFADEPAVIFGLMNEPARIPADRWAKSAAAGVQAIRASGARNLILVPGTYYSGAHSWLQPLEGTSNADAFSGFRDPDNNFAFEAHQYFDRNSSGTGGTCVSSTVGADALRGMTAWLRQQKHLGFLGEFGASSDPVCLEALRQTLAFIQQNQDAWLGWSYWAAGAWWGNYPFNVQPQPDGTDRPQMAVLATFAKQITKERQ